MTDTPDLTHAAEREPMFRHTNIRDEVYALLRRRILTHEYPPGFRFDLRELSSRFGISQTPMKEALQRLEMEGLVTIVPRRGTFVATFDTRGMAETYDVRLALERFVAPAIARNVTGADLDQLGRMLGQMSDLIHSADANAKLPEYVGLDFEFHCRIVALARNKRMDEIYAQVGGPLQLARVMIDLGTEVYVRFTEVEHTAIFRALEARDADALANALTEHVERAKVRLSAWFARRGPPNGGPE
ncbi:MAG: GntR family transcriptional regulator [Thermoflexales bacterium]|nr:GntR family transcriptional regulator [Thermoflexales bacterium]